MQSDDENSIDDLYEEDFDDPDFIDDDEILDFDDDEWNQLDEDDDDIDDEGMEDTVIKKKSGLSFEKMVIGGAILIGGLIVGTQVILPQISAQKAAKSVTRANTTSGLIMGGTTDNVIFKKEDELPEENLALERKPQEQEADQGFLYNPDMLDMSEGNLDDSIAPPSPALPDIEQDVALLDNSIEEDFSFDLSEEEPQKKEMVEIDKELVEEPLTQPLIELTPEPEEASALSVIKSVTNTSMDSSSVNEKLDSILSRLDIMDQKINDVRDNADTQIMALKGELEKTPVKPTKVSKKVPKPATVKKSSVPKKVVKRKANPIHWELRSAQPGKAWVSKKGQAGVQEISVGERLSGIGRVTSITQVGGRWKVSGTTGSIKQ